MDERVVHKFINKFKDRFNKPKPTYQENYEYAFSTEEIESINKQNKQKIQELKQEIFTKKKTDNDKLSTSEVLKKLTTNKESTDNSSLKPNIIENSENPQPEPTEEKEDVNEPPQRNSFINLTPEHQQLIMDKWNEINLNQIDKDIINGKDILNHNYTITYADDAAKFIHHIRKEYEIVICYLIGFNNEKQGIYDKTCFSSKIDDEWKHLNSYIKILEKIRKNK